MSTRLYKTLTKVGRICNISKHNVCTSSSTLQQPWLFDFTTKFVPSASYGGRQTITMIPGSGIGPEVMKHVLDVCKVTGAPLDFEIVNIDPENEDLTDIEHAVISVKRNTCAIKGQISVGSPIVKSKDMIFHQTLDLYANIVHCKSVKGINAKHSNVDVVIVRQNTEGEYKMLEHENKRGIVECLKIITRNTSRKVARYAFDFATLHGRRKVTVIHKANIMKLSDGLFLESAEAIAKEYPHIKFESMIVDAACMQVVMTPNIFDVILTINLYGNILIHIICGTIGGYSMAYGVSLNNKYLVFELGTRSIAKELVGRNAINPLSMLKSACSLLTSLGHRRHSILLKKAMHKTTVDDNIRTSDLGGTNTSSEVMDNIIKCIKNENTRIF